MLRVAGLSKRFGKTAALVDVSFEVRTGEVLGLIGPNGAGKSTLFECLAGLMPYDGGTVTGEGERPVAAADTLFYVPDGIAPWPAQPLKWALDYAAGFFGVRDGGLRGEVVAQLSLGEFLSQPIGTLSKGQLKRALIAIGLLTPQRMLLIDEPLDGLDLRQMRETGAVLRAHAARGRTLFLSIHQIADAARVCDRFVLLSGGRVRGEGTVGELTALASVRSGTAAGLESLEEVFLALT
jgi:ABC-2 type transport system ATP-binding protein